jgi:hypothetical protein
VIQLATYTSKFRNTVRNTILGIGGVALLGAAACGPQAGQPSAQAAIPAPAQAAENRQQAVYPMIVGQPLGVASNCNGNGYFAVCNLAIVMQDDHGQRINLSTTSYDQDSTTMLEAVIDAEINRSTGKPMIKVLLDTGGSKDERGRVTVDGVSYHVSQIIVEGVSYTP